MKKLLALVLVFALLFTFCSCAGKDNKLVCGVTIFENMNEQNEDGTWSGEEVIYNANGKLKQRGTTEHDYHGVIQKKNYTVYNESGKVIETGKQEYINGKLSSTNLYFYNQESGLKISDVYVSYNDDGNAIFQSTDNLDNYGKV